MPRRSSPTPARHPALIALAAAAIGLAPAAPAGAAPSEGDRVAVGFAASADAGERRAARAAVDGQVADTLVSRVQILEVPDGTAAQAVADLDAAPGVAWAEAGVRRTAAAAAPSDPAFASQWPLNNTGQGGGLAGADIDALAAWDISRGAGVLVGVVDSGVAAGHPDTGVLHTNTSETPGNLLDDDLNGLVDDVRGWDFVSNDADPADDHGHGTAVGSVVNAATDNARDMAGVAPGARVLHAKALAANGSGSSLKVARAMDYLADQGAPIVNLSLGGGESEAEAAVIRAHPETLFVVAAGNEEVDNDLSDPDGTIGVSYPCADPAPNVLCVGASDRRDERSWFSSYGRTTVDVMAPGSAVHVLLHTAPFGLSQWDGTSFASPVTAGIAALLKAARPAASAADLKRAILTSVDPVAAFAPITVTGGRVNAARALRALTGATLTAPVTPSSPPKQPPAAPVAPPAPTVPVEPPAEPAPAGPPVPAPVIEPPAPPLSGSGPQPRPLVRIERRMRLDARGHALVRLSFGAVDPRRQAAVRLLGRGGLLGAGSLRAAPRTTRTVRLTLTRRGRAALRSGRSVAVTVEVRVAGQIVRTTLRTTAARRR